MSFPRTARRLTSSLLIASALAGCDLQKDIDVPIPAYDSQLVVECYLVPGQPVRLLIQEAVPFKAAPDPIIVPGPDGPDTLRLALVPRAVAVISGPRDYVDTIRFSPSVDTTSKNIRGYTHTSFRPFNGRPGETYSLVVYDDEGRRVTGTTTVLAPVPINTVDVAFNPDEPWEEAKASVLMRFQDPAPGGDFYRYQVNQIARGRLDRRQGFAFPDDQFNGRESSVGSSYRFPQGDTMEVVLYHIDRAYYNYLRSVDDAQDANGNPFAQPARIKSTVEGGLGVFTNLAADRRRLILKR